MISYLPQHLNHYFGDFDAAPFRSVMEASDQSFPNPLTLDSLRIFSMEPYLYITYLADTGFCFIGVVFL